MTTTLALTEPTEAIVLPTDTWTPIRSGVSDSTQPNSGVDVIITATLVATPGVTCQVRMWSRGNATQSVTRTVTDTVGVFRLGPIVAATGLDIIELQAKRVTGSGGLVVITAAALQGALNEPGDGGTQTAIVVQPASQTVTEGDQASFSVTAVGENLSATIEKSVDAGSNWTTVGPGFTVVITNTTLAMDGDLYRFIVTGDNDPSGTPVTSTSAQLTVNPVATGPAVIQVEPSDQTVTVGQTAVFSAQASGIDSWNLYRRTTGTGDGTDIGGGVSPWGSDNVSYNHTSAQAGDDGWEYRFGLIGTDASETFTRWALLTVDAGAPAGGVMLTDIERGA